MKEPLIADEIRNALHLSELLHAGEHRTAGPDVGKSYFETHIRRLVAAVPDVAKPAAALHDVVESQGNYFAPSLERVAATNFPADRASLEVILGCYATDGALCMSTVQAIRLLTRGTGQSYYDYIAEIAEATGLPGTIARAVKFHDLIDNYASNPHGSLKQRYIRAIATITAAMVTKGETA